MDTDQNQNTSVPNWGYNLKEGWYVVKENDVYTIYTNFAIPVASASTYEDACRIGKDMSEHEFLDRQL